MNFAKILALGVGLMLGASTLSAQGCGQGPMGYRMMGGRMMRGGCAQTTAAQGCPETPQARCGRASEARLTPEQRRALELRRLRKGMGRGPVQGGQPGCGSCSGL